MSKSRFSNSSRQSGEFLKSVNTVTTFSKVSAAVVLIFLPIVTFIWGVYFAMSLNMR